MKERLLVFIWRGATWPRAEYRQDSTARREYKEGREGKGGATRKVNREGNGEGKENRMREERFKKEEVEERMGNRQ